MKTTHRAKFDDRDLPHDWNDVWDRADIRKLRQLIVDGYTVHEAASMLGRTEAGVRSKIYRLRQSGAW